MTTAPDDVGALVVCAPEAVVPTPFQFTVFESSNKPLNKTITLEDGRLKKIANGQFSEGQVRVIECDGLEMFKQQLEECKPNVAFSLGRPYRDGEWLSQAEIVTAKKLTGPNPPNAIARSKQFFRFAGDDPALFMFDVDGSDLTAEGVWQKLCEVDPQLASVGHLVVHSSSSHICAESTGKSLSGSSGYHFYCLVKDGADISRYGEMFAKRSWLQVQGRIEISKAGSFLVRQLIDACIYSSERLIFEAPVELGVELVQHKPEIEHHAGGFLDTELLKDLDDQEDQEYLRLVSEAKKVRQVEAHQIKERWIESNCLEIINRTGCDRALARQVAQQLLESDVLSAECLLKFDEHGLVSVGDVLADPEKFDQQTMADPIEHDYNGGRNIAIFYWNDGKPQVHSYAHGGMSYKISITQSDEQTLKTAIELARDDAGAHWLPEVMEAARNVYTNDRPTYQRLRAGLCNIYGKPEVRKWEKEILDSGEEQSTDSARELVNVVNVVSETFHDGKGSGYITIDKDTHKETWPLDSKGFYEWLEFFAYLNIGRAPTDTTMRAVIATLQGQAKHEGEDHEVFIRCAPYGGGYLIDMTNERWQVIKVTSDGWRILDESPVKFIRSGTSTAFPTPTKGNINDFWEHVNIPEDERTLVLAFMLDSLRPDTDFPVLELTGEHGTAKSSTHTRIRQLTDPNVVPLRSSPSDVQDIYISAGINWQASFENMSHLSGKMQDGLCTLATGGGFATRKLYTNTEESVIEVKRPCILNGISAVATRPDLIDRIIHLDLPRLDDFMSKQELDKRFEEASPGLFAGFLNIFSKTLKQLPHVTVQKLPRMGDFTLLGQALHDALDDERAFVDVYLANKADSLRASLEASPISLAVWEFAKDHPKGWTGTTKHLMSILDRHSHGHDGWPKSPKGLGAALRRMGPALREVGVNISSERKRDGYQLTIKYAVPGKSLGNNVHPLTPLEMRIASMT